MRVVRFAVMRDLSQALQTIRGMTDQRIDVKMDTTHPSRQYMYLALKNDNQDDKVLAYGDVHSLYSYALGYLRGLTQPKETP